MALLRRLTVHSIMIIAQEPSILVNSLLRSPWETEFQNPLRDNATIILNSAEIIYNF
jgi:hypothetical protein